MRDFAALVTGSLVGVQTAWVAETLSHLVTPCIIDRRSVIMLLCPHAIRSQENQGDGHGDHLDGQSCALWNGVQRMQRPIGRTRVVGVCEQPRSPSCLVLRELRS